MAQHLVGSYNILMIKLWGEGFPNSTRCLRTMNSVKQYRFQAMAAEGRNHNSFQLMARDGRNAGRSRELSENHVML